MNLKYKNGLLSPIRETEATTIIVYDRYKQPVAIFEEIDNDTVLVTTASDASFKERIRLSGMSIEKPVECEQL